jgi:hypothetical protein
MVEFSFAIVAHLVGDYLCQNDWMQGKTSSWKHALVHATVYGAITVAMTFATWPAWTYFVIWITHYFIDRYRLGNVWMGMVGQKNFRDNPVFTPWSRIIVDNSWHLFIAWIVYVIAAWPLT